MTEKRRNEAGGQSPAFAGAAEKARPVKRTVKFSRNARNVFLHLLTQCNLRCRHCYINPAQHGRNILSVATVEQWLAALARPDAETNVVFLGGEPTLHPDLSRAVRAARSLGYASVTIDTNGYLFHDILDKVTPGEVDALSFSLDGPEPSVNDPLRGAGSFAACVAGMEKAAEKGFRLSAIFTAGEHNLESLGKMPELLAGLGVSRFFIQVIGLRGSAAKTPETIRQVERERWEILIPMAAEKAAGLGLTAVYPKVYLRPGEKFECAGNVADNTFIFPNGRVYRCPLCEDYPLHSQRFFRGRLQNRRGITERELFRLDIPEGCVMNRLVQPGNVSYGRDGKPLLRIACCMLKEEISPAR
ncbi:MAG: radical SAM protein [Thermodesulfobacteriota bacterium]